MHKHGNVTSTCQHAGAVHIVVYVLAVFGQAHPDREYIPSNQHVRHAALLGIGGIRCCVNRTQKEDKNQAT